MPSWSRPLLLPVLAGILAACQQNLDTPVDCAVLCAGEFTTKDTILSPTSDSSFEGYVLPGQGSALLTSDGLLAGEYRAVVRFTPRPDSIAALDSIYTYTVDSVVFEIPIVARDTAVRSLRLILYRLPATTDSTVTFTDVQNAIRPANLIDTIRIADGLISGPVSLTIKKPNLSRVAIPAADSGVMAMAVLVDAATPTGVQLGSNIVGFGGPAYTSYVTLALQNPAQGKLSVDEFTAFNTFVSQVQPPLDPDLLTVGGTPSSRSMIRFALPRAIRDSSTIIRATLELTPSAPFFGLANVPTSIDVRAVLADLGSKSVIGASSGTAPVFLTQGSSSVVSIELAQLMQVWQVDTTKLQSIFLLYQPEGGSFGRPTYFSTRSPTGRPRLRVTYTYPFPFARP
jgi:hypothetical protein